MGCDKKTIKGWEYKDGQRIPVMKDDEDKKKKKKDEEYEEEEE